MNIDFSNEELLFLYGRVKKEYDSIKNQKVITISKSEAKLYTNLILKMESACPGLSNLPL